jgi:hypothetical protein
MILLPLQGDLGPGDVALIRGRNTLRLDLVALDHGVGDFHDRGNEQIPMPALNKEKLKWPILKADLNTKGLHP